MWNYSRSFARIHEVNLKKQGILPLTFANPETDYALISSGDFVSTQGLDALLRGDKDAKLTVKVRNYKTGEEKTLPVLHTMSPDQLNWLRSGSALNFIAEEQKRMKETAQ